MGPLLFARLLTRYHVYAAVMVLMMKHPLHFLEHLHCPLATKPAPQRLPPGLLRGMPTPALVPNRQCVARIFTLPRANNAE